ncbi:MAG: ABC transporter permease [Dehalococcoidia bacterium]|nr:hypothetical protein [Chloroflexota bacterium]MBT9160747.1 hypothetical protein [Chloroflexota bacterium]MBT9162492.1 hypothetical protein [Chloroflexota bacterium]
MRRDLYQVGQLAILEMKEYLRDRLSLVWAILFPIGFLFAGKEWWFPEGVRGFVIPTTITYLTMATGLFFFGMGVTNARSRGVLKTYRASPLQPWKYIAAQTLDRTLIVFLVTILVLLLGRVVYGESLAGNPVAFSGVILLSTATMLALGFALLAFIKGVEAVGGAATILFMLGFMTTGIIYLGDLPSILSTVMRHLPFHPISQCVAIIWMGFPVDEIFWRHLAILGGWLVGLSLIANRWFRWDI